jgi:hypothetical protein
MYIVRVDQSDETNWNQIADEAHVAQIATAATRSTITLDIAAHSL